MSSPGDEGQGAFVCGGKGSGADAPAGFADAGVCQGGGVGCGCAADLGECGGGVVECGGPGSGKVIRGWAGRGLHRGVSESTVRSKVGQCV
jgi:hypothetical protein